jgi:site-specific DNA-methyltransferase (adenine-specific)
VEAPDNYKDWTVSWLGAAKELLKDDGSMYIVSGWSKLWEIESAIRELDLRLINHLVWHYSFGVYTKKKFVTSHYHILYVCKRNAQVKFNSACRFGCQEREPKGTKGRSLQYLDMQDVWVIDKENMPGEKKNENKLPNALVEKMVLYSSDPGDMVCDFFMGNFTTAYVAKRLGRQVCGFELNGESFNHHMPLLEQTEFGCDLKSIKQVIDDRPPNQGKPVTEEEIASICKDYWTFLSERRKGINEILQKKYGRGRFSIKNILDAHKEKHRN